jgi:cyclophilin family peptidyl-prolyl cis-trans isomerase
MKVYVLLLSLLLLMSGCGQSPDQEDVEMGERTKVKMETSLGVMEFELYDDLAPETVGNFKTLIKDGFYDGTRFHRIIKDFMVQGGDPLSKDVGKKEMWGTGGPGFTIDDEFGEGLRHDKKGLLSMANSGPNTGGSQFFITLVPTPWLDGKHAIFGELVSGEDVFDDLGRVATEGPDRPVDDVVLEKVSIL